MALRGKKPTLIEKRLKMLLYGPPGTFKTTTSVQFPRPYLVDTERGSENEYYVKLLTAADGMYYFSNDMDEIITEVRSLISERHRYKTLVLDPLTNPYNDTLDKSAQMLATVDDPTGTAFSRHKGPADRKMKHLLALLLRLDMNIIITSHAKTRWERSGGQVIEAGQTFDCYGKLDYLFDLVLEIQKRGEDRVAIVRKTRLGGFPENAEFPFSYPEIAARYGKEILERDAVPVQLASPEQAKQLRDLLDQRKDGEALLEKWLDKSGSASIEEMPADTVDKCVAFLQGGGKPEAVEASAA